MLRGDDVSELQRRLNALGFDAGREDGIFGPDTETALRRFQRERGLEQPDGVCGPATIAALLTDWFTRRRDRSPRSASATRCAATRDVSATAGSSSWSTPASPRSARTTRKRLLDEGATVAIDASGRRPLGARRAGQRVRGRRLRRHRHRDRPGARCAYFANQTFRSEGGMYLARGMTEQLRSVLPKVDDPAGRTYRLLRETRMAAVVCELFSRDEPAGAAALSARGPEVAAALAVGIRRGVEHPIDVA